MCPQPRAAGKGKTFVSAASGAAASATWDGADDYVLACVGHLVSRPAPFSMNVPKTLAESAVLAGEIIAIFRAVSAVHTSSDSGTMATTEAPWLPALRPGPTPTGDCSAGDFPDHGWPRLAPRVVPVFQLLRFTFTRWKQSPACLDFGSRIRRVQPRAVGSMLRRGWPARRVVRPPGRPRLRRRRRQRAWHRLV